MFIGTFCTQCTLDSFSIYLIVIFVCLFGCPIITHEPLDRFASHFDWELGRTTKMVLAWLAGVTMNWVTWVLMVVHWFKQNWFIQFLITALVFSWRFDFSALKINTHVLNFHFPKDLVYRSTIDRFTKFFYISLSLSNRTGQIGQSPDIHMERSFPSKGA